jgi:large subunit ribosomal protein L17
MRLAKPRLGDAGTRAILEFVGQHDRVYKRATKPTFETAAAAPSAAPATNAPEAVPAEGAAQE